MAGNERQSGAGPGPRSWAEDLNTYRATRGSQSLSTLQDAGGVPPPRYCRTNFVPFLATNHKLYPYDDFHDAGIRVDPQIYKERCERHGWGDVSLLKQEGMSGLERKGSSAPRSGRIRPPSPRGEDRNGLFGVLQMTEQGGKDSWIGHAAIDPTKGKRSVQPPPDPKGRKDLFDVLHARQPGMPSDDSWLGHVAVDPAKGKATAPGPEQTRGRKDLTDIFAMSILHDPRRLELLQKGADKYGDAWCGNILIDPAKGRLAGGGPSTAEHMHGATFRPPSSGGDPALADAPRRHTKMVPAPVAETVPTLLKGEAKGDDWGKPGKRTVPDMPPPNKFDGRKDLYGHMTYKPLSDSEKDKYSRAFDDRGARGLRPLPPPGTQDPAKGADLLEWRPNVRLGQFVPHGGLAQENRIRGSTLRGTTGR